MTEGGGIEANAKETPSRKLVAEGIVVAYKEIKDDMVPCACMRRRFLNG